MDKKNQPLLYHAIEKVKTEQVALDDFKAHQKGHGKHPYWLCKIFDTKEHEQSKKWKAFSIFVCMRRINFDTKNKSTSQAERFYISDLPYSDAGFFFKGIRGHWTIKNSLHWVKNVLHREDNSSIRKANGPVNIAVISSIAINLGRKYDQWSITQNSVTFSTNIEKTIKIITT